MQSVSSSVKASSYDNHLSDALLSGTFHRLIKPGCACIYVVCGSRRAMFMMLCDTLQSARRFHDSKVKGGYGTHRL